MIVAKRNIADAAEQPHVYRAIQAREIISNAGRSRFVFWYEATKVRFGCTPDYDLWHTNVLEDAQHIIFCECKITSVGQLEDQWLPWKKPSTAQKKWDTLYADYTKWYERQK